MPTDFQKLLQSDEPILALAPMQDVTDLRFMRLIARYGNADLYFTEYFRVLPDSRPARWGEFQMFLGAPFLPGISLISGFMISKLY